MPPARNPGPLLARYQALPGGLRVRLRLARSRDREGIRDLFTSQGRVAGEVQLARLVSFDGARRIVLVATALIDTTETVVGVGVIAPDGSTPTLVLVDEARAAGLTPLLTDALTGHAAAMAWARAA